MLQCCRGGCKVWYWPCAECTADTELRPEFGQYRDIRQSQHCLVPGAHLPCCRPPASSLLPRGANFGQSLFELCVTQQSLYQKLKALSNTEICRCRYTSRYMPRATVATVATVVCFVKFSWILMGMWSLLGAGMCDVIIRCVQFQSRKSEMSKLFGFGFSFEKFLIYE